MLTKLSGVTPREDYIVKDVDAQTAQLVAAAEAWLEYHGDAERDPKADALAWRVAHLLLEWVDVPLSGTLDSLGEFVIEVNEDDPMADVSQLLKHRPVLRVIDGGRSD
jgi:hypothetical protein